MQLKFFYLMLLCISHVQGLKNLTLSPRNSNFVIGKLSSEFEYYSTAWCLCKKQIRKITLIINGVWVLTTKARISKIFHGASNINFYFHFVFTKRSIGLVMGFHMLVSCKTICDDLREQFVLITTTDIAFFFKVH